jgi:hypothetical protein
MCTITGLIDPRTKHCSHSLEYSTTDVYNIHFFDYSSLCFSSRSEKFHFAIFVKKRKNGGQRLELSHEVVRLAKKYGLKKAEVIKMFEQELIKQTIESLN